MKPKVKDESEVVSTLRRLQTERLRAAAGMHALESDTQVKVGVGGALASRECNQMIAGVDGCKKGWIAAIEDKPGKVEVKCVPSFREIVSRTELAVVVIDVPIGLTETGARAADKEARKLLKSRGCCVFPAPIRAILDCKSQQEASETWRSIERKGCSAQLWGIVPKIAEVDQIMRACPRLQDRVREGHPEVSFAVMNERVPIAVGKRKPEGQQVRQAMLAKYFAGVEKWLSLFPDARSDVIDAFSMLWTARRVKGSKGVDKELLRLPERSEPEPDRFGLYPRIVA